MGKIIFKNCNILDGTEKMVLKENYDILVENNKIIKIGKNLETQDAKNVDMNGAFCVPGLINLHVHLPAGGKLSKKGVETKQKLVSFIKSNKLTQEIGVAICKKYATEELLSGTTTIRSVGGVGTCDTTLRDRINKGSLKGPRIIACNEAIGVVHGHMDGTVAVAFKDSISAANRVEELKKQNVDWIKIMITGGILDTREIGHPGELKMPPEMVKSICDKAHSLGLKVCAHDEGPEGIKVAVKNGVDSIEHGSFISDELIKQFKKQKGVYVLTLSPAIPFVELAPETIGYPEAAQINTKVLLDGMIEMTNKCLDNNIPVGLGTDVGCPLVTHYDMYRELVYFEHYFPRVTKEFAIYSATLGNAKILKLDDQIGSIEEFKLADFFFVKENPLENLKNLSEPVLVVKNGEIFTKKVKKYPEVEKLQDEIFRQITK